MEKIKSFFKEKELFPAPKGTGAGSFPYGNGFWVLETKEKNGKLFYGIRGCVEGSILIYTGTPLKLTILEAVRLNEALILARALFDNE